MLDTMPKKSSRRFSKTVLVVNLVLIWALMFVSVIYQQSEQVIQAGMTLIGTIFSVYTGIGHLDFRKAVELSFDKIVKGQGDVA